MIGIVIVSHSIHIAEGVRELAEQITQDKLPIAIAAGFDDPENPIGTDAIKIAEAIKSVYSENGVIVFVDLGSAILNAETAIELLNPDWQSNIYLSPAPLVEGVVAAAVQANVGQTIENVLAEADTALKVKRAHLASSPAAYGVNDTEKGASLSANARELQIIVPNTLGLHARPAAQLVKIASRYKAKLIIRKGNLSAHAHSINQVAILGARLGDQLTFIADGEDAKVLLNDIQSFVNNNLGDPLVDNFRAQSSSQAHPDHVITGIPASKGVALGEAYHLAAVQVHVKPENIANVDTEKARLQQAINSVTLELKQLARTSKYRLGENEASIFEAQILILRDPELHKVAEERITTEKLNAEYVWWEAIKQIAERYDELDSILRERAADVRDVGRRVLRKLSPETFHLSPPDTPCIIVASELLPSDIAQLDETKVKGIITARGGATSHSAIIARALGVPAVIGVNPLSQIESGQHIAIDGEKGWVWTRLTQTERVALEQASQAWLLARAEIRAQSKYPVMTPDGKQIEIVANIGKPDDALKAIEFGAEGVGLFRTELLFMEHDSLPTEDEQYEAYVSAAQYMDAYPLIIRTLDIGGDKASKHIRFDAEANPALGYRGIRYWLDAPEIRNTQLRAIYRASADYNIQIMLPMLSNLEELKRTKQSIKEIQSELDAKRIAYDPTTAIGIMVEVPSAVLIAEQLAREVDFFSIGTNDLTQYIMAADRGNALVHDLVDYFQPSVLYAIKHIIEAGHKADIQVGMCGEMAGDTLAVPLLIAMGIDKLSMNAPSISEVKDLIRSMASFDTQAMLDTVLQAQSASSVKAYLQELAEKASAQNQVS